MPHLEHIEAIEKRLWNAADTLRANSNYASNEYFLPVMGLIFLRHAYSRFLMVKDAIEFALPKRGGKVRDLTKEDFSQKSAIFLQPKAQFENLVGLTDGDDRAKAIIEAMESIEADYENLRGVLPKNEYQELDNEVLGQLLRTLNPDELKSVSGDVFGRIYEYFLTQFADQKAHDQGEFFTPISLVSLIANVLEPTCGTVLDPACGSGGMFVQSARFVERLHEKPAEKLTFRGLEKNATTIRLAKMNLAVHGLEGDIQKAITYYDDPHEMLGKAEFVMANPPFNVDEIDADKIKNDPRLPFGLPGVNKKEKVTNGNYIWISYFYSYLGSTGRAGFVMSSQASSAGRDEAKVRQKLVETGDVDIMIAIRQNFFYTRTVPCELWFLDRNKPKDHKDKVLMIDARNIYRKVTRKIYDFSPEQEQDILAIVALYRNQTKRYLDFVKGYCNLVIQEAAACFSGTGDNSNDAGTVRGFAASLAILRNALTPFLRTLSNGDSPETLDEFDRAYAAFIADVDVFKDAVSKRNIARDNTEVTNDYLKNSVAELSVLSDSSRDLIKQIDMMHKMAGRLVQTCENEHAARGNHAWNSREITRALKDSDSGRQEAVEQLKRVRYFHRHARWLTDRFPNAELCNVDGLVRLVDRAEIAASDWSLTPGRYVGVAPEESDDSDFEERLRDLHIELIGLNGEAAELAAQIAKNFEELGV